jgi:hypothetical protein
MRLESQFTKRTQFWWGWARWYPVNTAEHPSTEPPQNSACILEAITSLRPKQMNIGWLLNLFRTWPAKMLGLMSLIFLVWLSLVLLALLIGAWPDGNGVLRKFG